MERKLEAPETLSTETMLTSLKLFRLKESRIEPLSELLDKAKGVNRQTQVAEHAQIRLATETQERINRLVKQQAEFKEEEVTLRSSKVVSLMYLKMYDELYLGQSLSDQEFMDFFKLSITASSKYWEFLTSPIKSKGAQIARTRDILRGKEILIEGFREESKKMYGDKPPSWFWGSKNEWETFLVYHTMSHFYLKPDIKDYEKIPGYLLPPKKDLPDEFMIGNFLVLKRGLPDWLLDYTSGLVPKEIVEQELAEDMITSRNNKQKLESINHQKEYLAASVNQRAIKFMVRFTETLRDLLPSSEPFKPQDFTQLLLYVTAIYGLQNIPQEPASVLEMRPEDLDRELGRLVSYHKHEEEVIKTFSSSVLSKECIALFLEKKLKEARMIKSLGETTKSHSTTLTTLLDSLDNKSILSKYKEQDKRLFGVLNYDLRPLFEKLPIDNVRYLRELIEVSKDEPLEYIIWEMAEAIKRSIDLKDFNLGKPREAVEKSLTEVVKFSRNWLKRNWRWAVEELDRSLQGEAIPSPESSQQEIAYVPIERTNALDEELEDTETAIRQIQEGSLGGWRILYTDNRTTDPIHLHEIGGKTLQERQEAFRRFLLEEGIACPINSDSVIRVLEWVVEEVPSEVEQIRMRMRIGEEIFRKIKRGTARVLYVTNPQDKTLVFFVHKKDDWAYRF